MFFCHYKQMQPNFNDPIGCIEVSLTKQENYMPFSGYKIMAPEYIYENFISDDLILVCNPLYVDEVKSNLQKKYKQKFENRAILMESVFYFFPNNYSDRLIAPYFLILLGKTCKSSGDMAQLPPHIIRFIVEKIVLSNPCHIRPSIFGLYKWLM